jgi:hypothetical protein
LTAALRRCDLRYCDYGDTDVTIADSRLSMLADLLGLGAGPRVLASSKGLTPIGAGAP